MKLDLNWRYGYLVSTITNINNYTSQYYKTLTGITTLFSTANRGKHQHFNYFN